MVLSKEDNAETLYINEKVCTAILIAKMQREKEIKKGSNQYFVNLLYYNFKYREYTAQTLELAIEGYFHGCDMGRENYKQHGDTAEKVLPPDKLKEYEFDHVVIAIDADDVRERIVKYLINQGVQKRKIV